MVCTLSSVQYPQVILFGNSRMNSRLLYLWAHWFITLYVWRTSSLKFIYIASVCPLKLHASNWLPKTYEAFVDHLTPIYLTSSEHSLHVQMTESHIFIRSNWISQGKGFESASLFIVPTIYCWVTDTQSQAFELCWADDNSFYYTSLTSASALAALWLLPTTNSALSQIHFWHITHHNGLQTTIHCCQRWLTHTWWFWYPPQYCMIGHDHWNLQHLFLATRA